MPSPRLIHLAETTSTMDEARRLAEALASPGSPGAPDAGPDPAADTALQEGILICAETQTKGRGTQARPWHSPRGMLMGTFLRSIPGPSPAASIPALTLRTALGIARLAERWLGGTNHPPVRIKWPNDILLGDAKLAGVLIEFMEPRGAAARRTIALIGVGLNANNPPPILPPDARPAASLHEHREAPLDLTVAAQQLAEALASATDQPDAALTDEELQALNQRLHAQGRAARVRLPDHRPTHAIINTINPDGTLGVLLPPRDTPHTITRTADIEWPSRSDA